MSFTFTFQRCTEQLSHALVPNRHKTLQKKKESGLLYSVSALRCGGFCPGFMPGCFVSWEEVVKRKSFAVWQRMCAAPIHRHFPFALSHAALLFFSLFIIGAGP